jgi:hypothetical protein
MSDPPIIYIMHRECLLPFIFTGFHSKTRIPQEESQSILHKESDTTPYDFALITGSESTIVSEPIQEEYPFSAEEIESIDCVSE